MCFLTTDVFIAGIWADNEDDDSEDEARGSTRFGGRKKKNYTAPVMFVTGGIHQPGNKPKEEEIEEERNDEIQDDIISDSSE